jgi:adenylosuccinate synthase
LCDNSPRGIQLEREFDIFQSQNVIEAWMSSISRVGELGLVVSDGTLKQWLNDAENVVFEGSQGVLLDEDVGFHPYTTWSRCTTTNAQEIIEDMAPGSSILKVGVIRSYAVRHGPGPLPTETNELTSMISEHNTFNEWQGAVRYGWLDAVLVRYALQATGRVDFLAVTHMDVLPRLKMWKYCVGYDKYPGISDMGIDVVISSGLLAGFSLPEGFSLTRRAQFSQVLSNVSPKFNTCVAKKEDVIQEIELLINQPVGMVSHGPGAWNVQTLNSLI